MEHTELNRTILASRCLGERESSNPSSIGTRKAGVISPYGKHRAYKLDWRLEQAGYRFVRYADDFVALSVKPGRGHRSLDLVESRHE